MAEDHNHVHGSHSVEQLPAFAVIQDDDRRGALWIAAFLSLIFVSMTLGARLYVRKRMLGRDDFASMAAVALAVAQYASLFAGMPSGLGTSKSSFAPILSQRKMASIFLTSQVVFVCGLYMAKLAVLLATERLLAADMKAVQRICVCIRVLLGLTALASLLLITLRCSVEGLLRTANERQCTGLPGRWLMVTILDAVTEVFILALFYGIVWSLQMRLQRKWMLTILLGLRIACPVFIAIYTSAIRSYATSSDPGVQVMSPLVWQQIALCYSLMSALVIALVPFIRSFHTGTVMTVHNMSNMEWGSGSGAAAGGGDRRLQPPRSYKLKTFSRLSKSGVGGSGSGGGGGGGTLATNNTINTTASTSSRRRRQQPPPPQQQQQRSIVLLPLSEIGVARSTSRLAPVPPSGGDRSFYYDDEENVGGSGGGDDSGDYHRSIRNYNSNGGGSGNGNGNRMGSGSGSGIGIGNGVESGSGMGKDVSNNGNGKSSSSSNYNHNSSSNRNNENDGGDDGDGDDDNNNNNNAFGNNNLPNPSNNPSNNPSPIPNPNGNINNVNDQDMDDELMREQHYREGMVIQKTMDWSVQYEEGEAGGLQHPGLPRCLF